MLLQFQRILYVNPEVTDLVLDLGVSKQNLNRAKIASRLVNHCSLRASKRMSSVVLTPQSNGRHPLVNQPSILSSAEVIGVVDTTGKRIVIDSSSPRATDYIIIEGASHLKNACQKGIFL